MKLNYQLIKEMCELQTEARVQIMTTNENDTPDTNKLDEFIDQLEEMFQSKSKHADFDELKSDLEWIEEYYEAKSWNDLTRWLTNIDSSLREFWSNYMDNLQNKDNKNINA